VGISRHLGVQCDDPDLLILEEETRPEQLARQIDRSTLAASKEHKPPPRRRR
jgi:hypothetical protein